MDWQQRAQSKFLKRTEDVVGPLVGLVLSVPIVAVAAPFIKRSSPGPVFYRQEHGPILFLDLLIPGSVFHA